MSDTIIRVENLGKKYVLGHQQKERYTALRDVLMEQARSAGRKVLNPFKRGSKLKSNQEEFWALRDLSFEVKQGDVVGIIGRNGAGKSTLLKILSRITEPTIGRIELGGRVASLLEVGTGFHPELTGRENIYLNGAILGMSRVEIKRKFDEIVDFAGIEKFLDTPVKRYSSGMYVRLAFAVAAHLEPEILVVDEVLAVGDAEFQKKCLGKMSEVAHTQGRTVLFVSHNMSAIKTLCSRAILLDKGTIQAIGEVEKVSSLYLQHASRSATERIFHSPDTAPGNEYIRVKSLRLIHELANSSDSIDVRTPMSIECKFWSFTDDTITNLSLHLYALGGECVFNSASEAKKLSLGLHKAVCYIPGNLLNDGIYTVSMMLVKDTSVPIYNFEDAISFEVADYRQNVSWYGKWPGVVRPLLRWDYTTISDRVEEDSLEPTFY